MAVPAQPWRRRRAHVATRRRAGAPRRTGCLAGRTAARRRADIDDDARCRLRRPPRDRAPTRRSSPRSGTTSCRRRPPEPCSGLARPDPRRACSPRRPLRHASSASSPRHRASATTGTPAVAPGNETTPVPDPVTAPLVAPLVTSHRTLVDASTVALPPVPAPATVQLRPLDPSPRHPRPTPLPSMPTRVPSTHHRPPRAPNVRRRPTTEPSTVPATSPTIGAEAATPAAAPSPGAIAPVTAANPPVVSRTTDLPGIARPPTAPDRRPDRAPVSRRCRGPARQLGAATGRAGTGCWAERANDGGQAGARPRQTATSTLHPSRWRPASSEPHRWRRPLPVTASAGEPPTSSVAPVQATISRSAPALRPTLAATAAPSTTARATTSSRAPSPPPVAASRPTAPIGPPVQRRVDEPAVTPTLGASPVDPSRADTSPTSLPTGPAPSTATNGAIADVGADGHAGARRFDALAGIRHDRGRHEQPPDRWSRRARAGRLAAVRPARPPARRPTRRVVPGRRSRASRPARPRPPSLRHQRRRRRRRRRASPSPRRRRLPNPSHRRRPPSSRGR